MSNLVLKEFEIASQSNPAQKYIVRVNRTNMPDRDVIWLSCNCKAWTTGRWNKGLTNFQRYCKHTDRARIIHAAEMSELGVAAPFTADQPKSEQKGDGIRRIQKIR